MLSYLQSGLPIIASVNPDNDMKEIVIKNKVGRLIENESIDELREKLYEMMSLIKSDSNIRERCINLWKTEFSTQKAADQILDFFTLSLKSNNFFPHKKDKIMNKHLLSAPRIGQQNDEK